MNSKISSIELGRKDRRALRQLVGDGNSPQKLAKRARIVLMTADGHGTMAIMRIVGVAKTTVWRWQEYFVTAGVPGLVKGRSKPPGKKPIAEDIKLRVVEKTMKERPANATHWSVRSMAAEIGISHTSVQRIWREYGLKPHLVRGFKVSNDCDFVAKVKDVVGLYLDPPEHAVVLAVDEKSQIQALDRTQPGLPIKKGRAGTMTHDYKRNGTTTLFAALDVASGQVIGQCLPRHRTKEFLAFLKTIDRETPADLDLHLILDNYATHKAPPIKRWLKRHPRVTLHFTPTSSSWLNLVERLFAEITRQRIRRGTFDSVPELEAAITAWIDHRNVRPKPFVWTAKPTTIIAKYRRARNSLDASIAATNV
ncbi:MAG TPA: IS630 family transposase [Devosiaceae bacterium]|jgi:transposase